MFHENQKKITLKKMIENLYIFEINIKLNKQGAEILRN